MKEAGTSLSELIAKILDTISITSWFPSIGLVAGGAFVSALGRTGHTTIQDALRSIKPATASDWLAFGVLVVVTTVAIQPFQFTMIRLLEGYWGDGRIDSKLGSWGRSRQARRLVAAEDAVIEFGRVTGSKLVAAQRLRELKTGETMPSTKRPASNAAADPARDAKIVAATMRRRRYPQESRVMPTRLGNVLRAAEDDASTRTDCDSRDIQTLLFEAMSQIPSGLLSQSELHRSRLDLYCTLWFVWMSLAVFATAVTMADGVRMASVPTLGAMAVASYYAALNAAESYGLSLRSIAKVTRRTSTQEPGIIRREDHRRATPSIHPDEQDNESPQSAHESPDIPVEGSSSSPASTHLELADLELPLPSGTSLIPAPETASGNGSPTSARS